MFEADGSLIIRGSPDEKKEAKLCVTECGHHWGSSGTQTTNRYERKGKKGRGKCAGLTAKESRGKKKKKCSDMRSEH